MKEPLTHAWHRQPFMDYDHCDVCGIVRNRHTEARACRGPLMIKREYPREFQHP